MRKLSFSKLFLLLILIGISSLVSAQKTFLYCGKLIDGISDEAQSEMTLVLEGNKIIAVNKGYTPAEPGAVVIDLKNKTVLPGLMDMHVHLEEQSHKNAFVETFTLNPADIAFRSLGFAETTLLAGFTTVRDLGGTGVNISLRNAINKGLVKGPRIYTAGKAISGTGGHMDPTNGYREDLMGNPGPESGVANGPDECRKAVRQQYKSGADLIKIASTGGVLSVAKDGSAPMFSEAEIRAIVETANDLGMKVACHAHGAEGIKRAIRAGVTSIEHGSLMDAEGIELMKKYGTWYVPTLTAGRSVADSAKIPGYYPDIVTPKALSIGPRLQETFGRAYKAGVKIAFGTDAGVYAHGRKAIKSATMNAAELLGIKDKLGSLQAGKLADIIALDENPLSNIKALQHVVFVMKDGVVYKK
jgi:imidazolonepropionase-like amidohydrolase